MGGTPARAFGLWGRLPASAASAVVKTHTDIALAVLDLGLLASGYAVTLLLRFDGAVPASHWEHFRRFLPVALVIGVASNKLWGLYGQVWRHASIHEAKRLLAAGASTVAALTVANLAEPGWRVPFSVVLYGTGLAVFLCAAVRFQSRLFSFRRNRSPLGGLRVVVIGARDAGATLVREMRATPELGLHPIAVLDPDPQFHGRLVAGVRVEGCLDRLPAVAERLGAHQAVLAMSSVEPAMVRDAAGAAERAGVALKIAPDMHRRMHAGGVLHDIRDVRIDDVLGREPVETDLGAVHALLGGRTVLITGAGGSIGSEIARQVARCQPSKLVILDHDETHLHDVMATLETPAVQVLADIRDSQVVRSAMEQHRPDVVFHAAAHKHVPLLESHPCEAVLTNVAGTRNVLDAARAVGVRHVVFISTDKAVRPASVMGASKRVGEQLVQTLAPEGAPWCAVRFGNVLGSRGSVVPTFMRQITEGGPVTVTDPRMTRYFMSIPEAVQLVLQAATLAEGGDIFVLDMGEPVQIMELAQRMIRLSGRRVGADIEIQVTGARPGEKLCEELHTSLEECLPTAHAAVTRVLPDVPSPTVVEAFTQRLSELAASRQDDPVRALLFELAWTEAVDTTFVEVSGRVVTDTIPLH